MEIFLSQPYTRATLQQLPAATPYSANRFNSHNWARPLPFLHKNVFKQLLEIPVEIPMTIPAVPGSPDKGFAAGAGFRRRSRFPCSPQCHRVTPSATASPGVTILCAPVAPPVLGSAHFVPCSELSQERWHSERVTGRGWVGWGHPWRDIPERTSLDGTSLKGHPWMGHP